MTSLPPRITAVLDAALHAVDPGAAVRAALSWQGQAALQRSDEHLQVGEQTYRLSEYRRIFVVGAGKAGAPMAQAVEEILGDRITDGCVVVKYDHQAETQTVRLFQSGHPVPDQNGLLAGSEVLKLAGQAAADDLVICLISGGGSALLESLPPAISLLDLQTVTDLLLACGASIVEFNTLRKHISLIKGGQLARAAAPATLLTLVLSDVVGSPLDIIASGPAVPDTSTWADAWAVIERYDLAARLPATVRERLLAGLAGEIPDTPKPGDPAFARAQTLIVADNAVAAAAARDEGQRQGYNALILSTFVEGEAAEIAKVAVALAREVKSHHRPVAPPACLILGGETTVILNEKPGRGGRNQELALAAALALDGMTGITVVSLATDGTDGPTDAAGGWAEGTTVEQGRSLGLDARAHLARHDAYPFLQATGALLMTGPTRTNVNDLIFVFVEG